jgi:16S rRNA (cytidine1402-2'-O)-methyltransferase
MVFLSIPPIHYKGQYRIIRYMSGILTLGAVHIGNKMDMSLNIINSIISHDVIAVENVIFFKKLLYDLKINTNAQIEEIGNDENELTIKKIIKILKNNKNVLLLSDQGTSGFCDPGGAFVKFAIEENIKVTTIPGPNSAIAALTVSGIINNGFIYAGHPNSSDENKELLNKFINIRLPILFLCNPENAGIILTDALEIFDENTYCVACVELTTKFENVIRCSLKEMLKKYYNNELFRESVIIIDRTT